MEETDAVEVRKTRHKKHQGLNPKETLGFVVLASAGLFAVLYIFKGTPELPNVRHVGCFASDASFSQVGVSPAVDRDTKKSRVE